MEVPLQYTNAIKLALEALNSYLTSSVLQISWNQTATSQHYTMFITPRIST